MNKIEEIINNSKNLITENYFIAQEKLESLYGKYTILLIQIGSFYEVYGTENKGKAKEIAKILNIALTKKNKSIETTDEKNPFMCGFPDVAIDKHLEKLVSENKWNIVIVNQKGTGSNVSRYLERIVSPGTNIDYLNEEYNFLASVSIEKTTKGITFGGISLIDVSIGKTLVLESYSNQDDCSYAIDSIKDVISKYNVSELIITYENFQEEDIQDIFDMNIKTHFKNISEVKKEKNIEYQNALFKNSFKTNSILSPIEELNLERSPNISLSLSVLITFITEHNYNLSQNIQFPTFIQDDKFLYLGNNPLSQLNIINGKYSLEKIINKGISSIGKRYIKEQLLNPLKDINEINKRFSITLEFLEISKESNIENNLKNIYDIERIWRKIQTEKIHPFEAYNLYTSLKSLLLISKENIKSLKNKKLKKDIKSVISILENSFNIDKMSYFNINNITSSFIKNGVSKELDSLNVELNNTTTEILKMAQKIDSLIEKQEYSFDGLSLKESKKIFSNINICFNETEGYYIEISKNKYSNIKENIDNIIKVENGHTKNLKNSVKIYLPNMLTKSNQIVGLEQRIILLNKSIFKEVMTKVLSEININELSLYIGQTEFYLNNIKLIKDFNYKIPTIVESEESFVDIKDLRHPIIERFEHNGIFVSNDLVLGDKRNHDNYNDVIMQGEDKVNGLMLYGLNSSGKTTLSKALGIAIIMGQAGFPISGNCKFSLFENIFTRIKGDDDLEKGLSTFTVEMLELKNILNRANNKTLVLGDEISHGTETISGLSIVSAAVLELIEKDSLFLFATHLHQLREIKEFNDETKIKDVHLTVHYNEKEDDLIYDRKLKSGSGSSLYGLEYSKFLKLPTSFLKRAYKIRNNLAKDLSETELITKNKKSVYNSKHLVTVCEICGEKADDVHHIKEQHLADENGNIENIHKNHKFNLVNLCKKHHKDVHNGKLIINGYKKTSTGFILDYEKTP